MAKLKVVVFPDAAVSHHIAIFDRIEVPIVSGSRRLF
jgi:hypothetical protein